MLVKIAIVVAMCSGVKYETVQSKLIELQKDNPGAQVTLRLDQRAKCYQGHVLTGRDAKLLEQLQGK